MDEILNPKSQSAKPLDAGSSVVITVQTTMDTFLRAAHIEAVYGAPLREGETTVIPAAEVLSIAGFGLGAGSGSEGTGERENAGGGGGGGGGRVLSRPVAAIVISPAGVRVQPIVDVTKIALATFTTLGFMLATLARIQNTKPRKLRSD
jgi:uncharacterized spore protein YtfJ